MSDTARLAKRSEPGRTQPADALSALMALNAEAVHHIADFNLRAMKIMTECSQDMTGFVGRRLRADLELPQKLATCREPQAVMAVWGEFWRTAMEQYSRELRQMTTLGDELMTETVKEISDQAEAAIETAATGGHVARPAA